MAGPLVDLDGFLPGERAGAVGEEAAGTQGGGGGGEELPLEDGQSGRIVGTETPAGLGAAAQHAEPGAGGVEEDPVEAARGHRQGPAVGHHRVYRGEAEAPGGLG